MLKSTDIFGRVTDRVAMAIERIQQYTKVAQGRGLEIMGAFSGGKDSCVIRELTDMAGIDCRWVYNQVGIDPPELVQFIKDYHPDVERIRPPMPFFRLMVHKEMFPPLRQQRWCCRLLKEYHGSGLVIIGIRAAESARRAKRAIFEPCKNERNKYYLSPIIDWEDEDVWEFIHIRNIPYCSLYDEGMRRLGCLFCPNATPLEKQHAVKRWPKMAHAFIVAFNRVIELRKATGKKCTWVTGQELFDWWISGDRGAKEDADQQCFRFDN